MYEVQISRQFEVGFVGDTFDTIFQFIEELQIIKNTLYSKPPKLLVSSNWNPQLPGILKLYNNRKFDFWGISLYNTEGFSDLFEIYKENSKKPLIISNFGAVDWVSGKGIDEEVQAKNLLSQWNAITNYSDICLGGIVTEVK